MLEGEGGVDLRVGGRMRAQLNQNGCWREREGGLDLRVGGRMRAQLNQNGCWRERVELTRGLVLELEHS